MECDNYPGHILDLLVAFWLSGLGIVEGGSGIQVLMLFQLRPSGLWYFRVPNPKF